MKSNVQEKIFSSLQISADQLLAEMAILLSKQQLSEYAMEIAYLEKKYGQTFPEFDRNLQTQAGTYELENDWLQWKFAVESQRYWLDLLAQVQV